MYISIDQDCGGAAPYKWKKVRQESGETERENVCACECWPKLRKRRSTSVDNVGRDTYRNTFGNKEMRRPL